jgi:hypothetical protein
VRRQMLAPVADEQPHVVEATRRSAATRAR